MQASGLMIAAPHSGSGKTVLTLALLAALRVRGIDIRAAKAGPDYIDPAFHEAATGRASVNLDPWAMNAGRLRQLARRQGGTHLLVEAMMGLFDGAADGSGSAGDLAAMLGLPVVLVIDAARQSHSVAALARGFRDHRRDVKIAGVVLNRVAGARHEAMLRAALSGVDMPVLGALAKSEKLQLPERHLGLVQARENSALGAFIANAAEIVGGAVDLDALIGLFAPLPPAEAGATRRLPPLGQHIAIARDDAFSFVYPHWLMDWREGGAALSFFSPLADETPAADADAIFLPGGYPELHGGELASATGFRDAMIVAAARGARIYGECGGYMVLGQGIEDADSRRHAMLGLLDLETSFARRKLHLGYRRVEASGGFGLGKSFTAHEFHYSTALREKGETLFCATASDGSDLGRIGLRRGSVCGSYLHLIDAAD
jgi:cobyrinic acid a,c-diamide synthase